MNDEKLVHPKSGIVSVGLAVAKIVIPFFVIVVLRILGEGEQFQQNLSASLGLFLFAIPPVFSLLGLILGIAGALNKYSNKLLPILGIVLNSAWLVLEIGWWIMFALILYIGANMVWR